MITACDVHTSFWDQWFDGDPEENPDGNTPDGENPGGEGENPDVGGENQGGWFDDFFDNLFD